MRRLLPDRGDERLDALYEHLAFPAATDRPYVFLGMVSSLDGAATVEGVSDRLGGEADHQAFRRLRAAADAVLVGAATVRAEDYRGVRLPEEVASSRAASGRDAIPPIVVVTRSVTLDPTARLFHDTTRPPWLLVPEDAPVDRLAPLRPHAEIIRAGRGGVDLPRALRELRARGVTALLGEGGPALNAQLLAAGLVDELFMTIAPDLVGGGRSIVDGDIGGVRRVEIVELHEHADELLLRVRVHQPPH